MYDSIRGSDVSHWQGKILWRRMARRLDFVIVKLSDGARQAKGAIANLEGARAAGMIVGAYHMWQPDIPVAAQLDAIVSALPVWYGPGQIPIALDAEKKAIKASIHAGHHPAEELGLLARIVEEEVGCRPLIYVSPRGIHHLRHDSISHLRRDHGLAELPALADLWLARYGELKRSWPAEPLDLHECSPWPTLRFWQYSSSLRGHDHGAESRHLDGDLFMGDRDDLVDYSLAAWG